MWGDPKEFAEEASCQSEIQEAEELCDFESACAQEACSQVSVYRIQAKNSGVENDAGMCVFQSLPRCAV
jgi:hypothetical protein